MKTAREIAHEGTGCEAGKRDHLGDVYPHFGMCDVITAAIEARDAEWGEALRVAREALEYMAKHGEDRGVDTEEISQRALARLDALSKGSDK